ncbi:MAG: amidoligase family protein [Defluviicoccus sp.]
MLTLTSAMLAPPVNWTDAGRERRIGVEIEFCGLSVPQAAQLIAGLFGGSIETLEPHRAMVRCSRWGDFVIELDSAYAHPDTWRSATDVPARLRAVVEQLATAVGRTVGDVASLWMPIEIVGPPVPLATLVELEQIIVALRDTGAEGTDQGWLFAFGTQLNIELPATNAATILGYLKAYVLLSPWLRQTVAPDRMRQLLPFIDPFPDDYIARVIDPTYAPALPELARDYLAANPTRNRELDLLPLLAHTGQTVPDLGGKAVKARPALHYRLPDTRLSDPAWGLIAEWNRWVEVERLAHDPAALARLAAASRMPDGELADQKTRLDAIEAWRDRFA